MPKNKLMEQDIDFMTIPFGPQHPGSGHFHAKVKCDGESVVELTPYPGYLHRGFEKLMEYRTHVQNVMLSDRVCVLDPFPNEIGYLNGVEKIAGVEVPERAKFIRSVMAELGRILSLITWGGVMSMALGLDSGTRIFWGDREKLIRLQEMITGGRIYPCYLAPGGVRVDFRQELMDEILQVLDYLENKMGLYDDLIFYNPTFVARL